MAFLLGSYSLKGTIAASATVSQVQPIASSGNEIIHETIKPTQSEQSQRQYQQQMLQEEKEQQQGNRMQDTSPKEYLDSNSSRMVMK